MAAVASADTDDSAAVVSAADCGFDLDWLPALVDRFAAAVCWFADFRSAAVGDADLARLAPKICPADVRPDTRARFFVPFAWVVPLARTVPLARIPLARIPLARTEGVSVRSVRRFAEVDFDCFRCCSKYTYLLFQNLQRCLTRTCTPSYFFECVHVLLTMLKYYKASLRERLILPFSSVPRNLTFIASPTLQMSSTFSTLDLSSFEM